MLRSLLELFSRSADDCDLTDHFHCLPLFFDSLVRLSIKAMKREMLECKQDFHFPYITANIPRHRHNEKMKSSWQSRGNARIFNKTNVPLLMPWRMMRCFMFWHFASPPNISQFSFRRFFFSMTTTAFDHLTTSIELVPFSFPVIWLPFLRQSFDGWWCFLCMNSLVR